MLKMAYDYRDTVDKIYSDLMMEDRSKWLSGSPVLQRPDWDKYRDNNYEGQYYLSAKMADEDNGELLGEIRYTIDQWAQAMENFHVIHYNDEDPKENGYIFMKDLLNVIHIGFTQFGLRKMCWSVIVGNPIEKSWDKFCRLSNGRIVGVYKEDAFTADRVFRDVKAYELFAKDFYETPLGKRCIKMFGGKPNV